jgi:hypothetical protein
MNALSALLTFALLAGPESGEGWVKAAETDGITVFTRDKPGSEVKETKALGTIDAPPEAVWKVLRDYPKYKERMPYTEVATVVGTEDGGKVTYFYSKIGAPFVAKRDYTLKIVDESDWKEGKGFLKINDGFWLLEPKDGGKKTQATYYLFTDPGGSIPKFLVNQANSGAVPDVFRAIRKHSTQPSK